MAQKWISIICFHSLDDVSHQSAAACLEAHTSGRFDVPWHNITKASFLWIIKRMYTYRVQTLRYLHVEISERGKKISLSFCCLVCSWISKTKWAAFESAALRFRLQHFFCRFTVLMHLEKRSLQSTHTHSTPKWHLFPRTSSTFALFEAEHSFINAMKGFPCLCLPAEYLPFPLSYPCCNC